MRPAMIEDKYPIQNSANPARIIEGEAVIITPDDSQLHTLNEVGTFVWERADGAHTVAQIVDELCRCFEVERERAERDVSEFIARCQERNLMLLQDAAGPAQG
ncbi:MAG: PqqD family protein [Deltaproteobacteria bacterium]|nr:PqqD family protein [Deltaproteobacteria bacterium]